MAWNPKALIDPVKKKDDQNADKQKPAASNSTAPAPNSGTSPTAGSTAAPPPQPEVVESPEVFGSRVPPPPGGGSTWDPTKQPRRPSIAVFKPDAVDDALQGIHHFDVTPGELGMNPPSIAWFVCLTFTMFSLTLAVLFIAYYVNRPGPTQKRYRRWLIEVLMGSVMASEIRWCAMCEKRLGTRRA
ncbi:hypothetical protein MRX96_030112 [Rhipicephalus microplus]